MAVSPDCALSVRVEEGASSADLDRLVGEALVVHEARNLGWTKTDPVIRARLVEEGRLVWGREPSDDQLLEEAIAHGKDRADPLVRARLLDRARRALVDGVEPSDETIRAWMDRDPGPWMTPERRRVRLRRSEGAQGQQGLAAMLPGHEGTWTHRQIAARWGVRVADSAFSADLRVPVPLDVEGVGRLQLFVEEVFAPRMPRWSEVRASVRQAWLEEERERRFLRHVEALKEACDVTLVSSESD